MSKVDRNWIPRTDWVLVLHTQEVHHPTPLEMFQTIYPKHKNSAQVFVNIDWINCMVYTMLRRCYKIYSSMPSFPMCLV